MANEKRLDLIDRNALREELSSLTMAITGLQAGKGVLDAFMQEYRKSVLRIVDDAPTVDAVEVVHGRWIHVPSSDMMTGKAYKCSECNKMRYGSFMPNYCQCCGAKMGGGNEDG